MCVHARARARVRVMCGLNGVGAVAGCAQQLFLVLSVESGSSRRERARVLSGFLRRVLYGPKPNKGESGDRKTLLKTLLFFVRGRDCRSERG